MIDKYLKNVSQRVKKLSFIFILIVFEVYFLINGKAHFPDWDDGYSGTIMVYLIMTLIFLVWSGRETKEEIKKPLHLAIGIFVGFFFVTYFLLAFVTTLSGSEITPISKDLFWQTVIFQVCVVATAEELMFRGVLLEHVGVVLSSVMFAAWHAYAYGVLYYSPESITYDIIFSISIAFFMGVILALIEKQKNFGLIATISIHSAYNLFVSGAFITWSMM